MPMINIALESGFAHQAHFANVFKKVTGMTPSHYRHAMGVRRTPKHHC
jgi:AraC-like DNA-binding protein